MDVTPQELRKADFKEAFRGYARDDVTEVLERCAATIEHLSWQVRELESKGTGESSGLPTRGDADVLARALVLAQKAADDAVTDAEARAEEILHQAETRAQSLVSEAEMNARRLAEAERSRFGDELDELVTRRDQLRADADALDEFVSSYRDRVRTAVESDLEALIGTLPVDVPSAPELQSLDELAEVTEIRSVARDPASASVWP
jgi:DivIVA domain-containing protein